MIQAISKRFLDLDTSGDGTLSYEEILEKDDEKADDDDQDGLVATKDIVDIGLSLSHGHVRERRRSSVIKSVALADPLSDPLADPLPIESSRTYQVNFLGEQEHQHNTKEDTSIEDQRYKHHHHHHHHQQQQQQQIAAPSHANLYVLDSSPVRHPGHLPLTPVGAESSGTILHCSVV